MNNFLNLESRKLDLENFPPRLNPIKIKKPDYYPGDIFDDTIKLATSEYGRTLYELFKSDNDSSLLLELAKKHGTFLEKFFERELGIRVKRKIIEDKIELKKYYPLFCTRYNFGIYEKVEKYLPQHFALDFFIVSIYNHNNEEIYTAVKEWYNKHFVLRKCAVCGKEYRVTSFPDWVYYGANGHISICFECPVTQETEREKLLRLIPQLVENCGFVPNSDFSPINHNFSMRVKDINWDKTAETIFQMGVDGNTRLTSDNIYKTTFGSWFKALVEAGVLKDNVLVFARGIKCIANSGNECNSLDEQYIDNWLFNNGFDATKEPVYPKHEKYNSSGRRRADWLVNDYYIEYFGLAGDDNYDKKTIEKMNLVRELDLKLIALFPEDLSSLDIKLKALKNNLNT